LGNLGNLESPAGGSGSLERLISGGLLNDPALRQYRCQLARRLDSGAGPAGAAGPDLALPSSPHPTAIDPAPRAHPTGAIPTPQEPGEGSWQGGTGRGPEQQRGLPGPVPPWDPPQPPLRPSPSHAPQWQAPWVGAPGARSGPCPCPEWRTRSRAPTTAGPPPSPPSWTRSCSRTTWKGRRLRRRGLGLGLGGGRGEGGTGGPSRQGGPRPRTEAASGRGEGERGGGMPLPYMAETAAAPPAAAAAPEATVAAQVGAAHGAPEGALAVLAYYLREHLSRQQQEPPQHPQHHHHYHQEHQQQQHLPQETVNRPYPQPSRCRTHGIPGACCTGGGPGTCPSSRAEQGAGPSCPEEDGCAPPGAGWGAPGVPEDGVPVVHGMRQRRPVEILEAGEEGEVESVPRRRKRHTRGGADLQGAVGSDRVARNDAMYSEGASNSADNALAVLPAMLRRPSRGAQRRTAVHRTQPRASSRERTRQETTGRCAGAASWPRPPLKGRRTRQPRYAQGPAPPPRGLPPGDLPGADVGVRRMGGAWGEGHTGAGAGPWVGPGAEAGAWQGEEARGWGQRFPPGVWPWSSGGGTSAPCWSSATRLTPTPSSCRRPWSSGRPWPTVTW